MKQSTALLLIDTQYDFCHPEGALFVPGAEEDVLRIAKFIERGGTSLHHIVATLDTHQVIDISHPRFWQDAQGSSPTPFTFISHKEVVDGKWTPLFSYEQSVNYLHALEKQGEFQHIIWPEHCLAGTLGATLDTAISQALYNWTACTNKNVHTLTKGMYPFTEHFGIFEAQVQVNNIPDTQLNTSLLKELNQFDRLIIAGEARSHCVATSVKQILVHCPSLAKKTTLLTDCMSDVTGLGHLANAIFENAQIMGVQFSTSTDFLF